MAIIKCKMCGGDVVLSEDKTFGTCDHCGSTMTFPKVSDEQRAAAFNRGNHFRRMGEFDKALAVYERIVAEDDNDAEAHWCCALCRFGIEYVEDPATYEWLPTCHRASFDSFLEDVDYLAALEHSDGITRRQYQKDAAKIADVQRGILATSQNAEPYDVFISYKELDAQGERTRDSILAQEIYYRLTEKGWRVFFSRISLEDVPGTQYEPYIFAALNSAKVMVVVGTSAENLNAVWVKNEWSRYLSLMRKDRSKLLVPCYRDMDPYDLPEQLSVLMSYDMGKLGFIQDLIRGVDKVLGAEKPRETAAPAQPQPVQERVIVQQSGGGPNVTALLKRGQQALEDNEWEKARGFYDQVLSMDAENAEAFIGLALAGSRSRDLQAYINGLCSGSVNVETDQLARDKEHIQSSIAKSVVPGYCDGKEMAKFYDFDVSYPVKLRAERAAVQQIKSRFDGDRNLNRAFRYAQGETKQKLESTKQSFSDVLEKRIKTAEALDKQALDKAKAEYARKLELADRKAEEMSRAAQDKREADYQAACKQLDEAKTPLQYRNAAGALDALKSYKDSEEKRQEALDRAFAAAKAEQEAKEKAKAAKAKKRKKTIAIVTPIIIACIAFVILLTTVIIPKKKLNQAMELLDSGDYEAAYAMLEEIGDNGAIASSKYNRAVALMDSGDYEAAYILFNGLDYKDSASKCLRLCPVGGIITFGSYEQDNNTSNGKEDVEWLVLAKEDNRVLLISKYALDCQQYNTEYKAVIWETCSLRKWLNETFLSAAFSEEERAMILGVTVSADRNPSYNTSPGNSTTDQVFLLSITEANKYFSSDEARKCAPTPYAIAQGGWTSASSRVDGKATCWWWLRSPGYSSYIAAGINDVGSVHDYGNYVNYVCDAVRPALWIEIGD